MNYWLVVGSVKNWETAFSHGNIWGLRQSQRNLYDSIVENRDKVVLYATRPVGGVIGYGLIRHKFLQDKTLWPEEIKKKEVIWPLRFEYDVEFALPPESWEAQPIRSKELFPRAGFQTIAKNTALELITQLEARRSVGMVLAVAEEPARYETTTQEQEEPLLSHAELQDKLVEIGKLQKYIADKEYSFEIGRLDVVWRRIMNSVPTYVFEIQVGGDVYHALSKLKHAHDLWNSNIFLIAGEKERTKTETLLSGTFHEIRQWVKFIELDKINELHRRKKQYYDFENELGIAV